MQKKERRSLQTWLAMLAWTLGWSVVLQFIIIPLGRWVASALFYQVNWPLVTISNLRLVITHHPWALLGLILELLIALGLTYWLISIWLQGIQALNRGRLMWMIWRPAPWPGFGIVMLTAVVCLPWVNLLYRTPLWSQIKLPVFILDFLPRHTWLWVTALMLYLLAVCLLYRWVLALPLILTKPAPGSSLRKSWQVTRGRAGGRIWGRIMSAVMWPTLVLWLIYGLVRELPVGKFSSSSMVGLIAFLQLISELALAIVLIRLALRLIKLTQSSENEAVKPASWQWSWLLLMGLILLGGKSYWQSQTINRLAVMAPIVISHRGVDGRNGVQNTLPAFLQTIRTSHPDYVEIDVHETKDSHFIVLHDDNLKKLAGLNKRHRQLTLAQLQKLTVTEKGYQAKLVSLDQYLKIAQQHHQKLIVELKTTSQDSPSMVKEFTQHYAKTLVADHDLVHSLDYQALKKVQKYAPQAPILDIQGYNLMNPRSSLRAYTMEYGSLNSRFIQQVHANHQQVFAWTVDSPMMMRRMILLGVDGIVTDHPSRLRQVWHQIQKLNHNRLVLWSYLSSF